jgi:hypothetical protein
MALVVAVQRDCLATMHVQKTLKEGWRMAEGLHEIRDEKPIDVPFIWEPLVTFSRPAANGIYLKTGFA